ncbi:MAG: RAD55 family ATPase [Candidatus Nanohaloarchaeota archaeon QJJ-9]|nr:RAD55 family ATPase [Candidatus Nanohaloarchaeota archaeon QJJ-9]
MVKREETGIEKLDSLLDGGLPKGSTVFLIGEPGTGKSTFINQFMEEGLSNSERGLYITFDNAPEEVMESANNFGWDFEEHKDNFAFLDAYSWKLGKEVDSEYAIQGPSDLNAFNMTLTDALRGIGEGEKRIVADSISTMVLYTDVNSAVKFLQVVSAKSKASDGVLLLTLEEGVQDKEAVSKLNYVADGVINLKIEDDKRYIKISRMSKTSPEREWHRFEIKDNGIELMD